MKTALVNVVLFLVAFVAANLFVKSCVITNANAASDQSTWEAGNSKVVRIIDARNGIICYVVPREVCVGDCAYSPAISCIKN
jgi:hypothetical protein